MKIKILFLLPFFFFSSLGHAQDKEKLFSGRISIHKDFVENQTKFLLKTQLISQNTVELGSARKSFIVTFNRCGEGKLCMNASTVNFIDKNSKPNAMIADFTVIESRGGFIEVDWNKGMNRFPVQTGWLGYHEDKAFLTYDWSKAVSESRPLELKTIGDKITITQLLTLSFDLYNTIGNLAPFSPDDGKEIRLKVKYTLEPYIKNESFIPHREMPHKRRLNFGYFESYTILEENTGDRIAHTSKWDNSKPIVFHISHNTPEYLKKAVKEGLLYWSRATKDFKVETVEEKSGITAPSDGYNMVQWLSVDSLGLAYADATTEPLTGEILQANVYLSSVFAVGSRNEALQLLKKWKNMEVSTEHTFRTGALCQGVNQYLPSFIEALRVALVSPNGGTDELFQKISQDHISLVVAHEVGHTLGLRHNFAGSLHSNVSRSQRLEFFKSYLNGELGSVDYYPFSTVMDYNSFTEILIHIHRTQVDSSFMGEYDRLAIQNLYSEEVKQTEGNLLPLFCKDSDVAKYVDCNRGDHGSSLVEKYFHDFFDLVKRRRSVRFINSFLINKYEESPQDSMPFEGIEILLNPTQEPNAMLTLLTFFDKKSRYISVESQFPRNYLALLEDEVQEAKYRLLSEQFQFLDNKYTNPFLVLMQLTFPEGESLFEQQMGKVRALLDGQHKNNFTEEEKEIILEKAYSYFKTYSKKMPLVLLSSLTEKLPGLDFSQASKDNHGFVWLKKLEEALKDTLVQVVTKKSDVTLSVQDSTVDIKKYAYDIKLRSLAAQLLLKWPKSKLGSAWNGEGRKKVKAEISKDYEKWKKGYGADFFSRNHGDWSLLAWIQEQKQIMGIFSIRP